MTVSSAQTRIMQNARVHLPGAVDAAMQLELYNVLFEFFGESNIWINDITVNVTTVDLSYTLTPADTPSSVNRLLGVIDANSHPILDISMQTPGTLVLGSLRTTALVYTATVALNVVDPVNADNFPVCPAWIVTKYTEQLTAGVIGRMMAQPAKAYTNERLGIFNLKKFGAGVAKAKYEALHKNVFRAQSWAFPSTFAVRRQGGSVLPPQ